MHLSGACLSNNQISAFVCKMQLNEKTLAAKEKRKIYNEKFVHRFYINRNIYMYFVLAENTRKPPCITRTTNNRGSTIWKQGNTRQPRGNTLLQRNKLEKGRALHLNKLEFPSPKDALWQVWSKLAQWFWRRRFF